MPKNEGFSKSSKVKYRQKTVNDKKLISLTLKDAVEFMTKKDYFRNREDEMREELTFYDFDEWTNVFKLAGFDVIENPNEPEKGSRIYTSEWIAKNRWEGKAELYTLEDGHLAMLGWPPTTMIMVEEKR